MKKKKLGFRGGQNISFSTHTRVKEGDKRKQKHNREHEKKEVRAYKGRRPNEVGDFYIYKHN